MVFMISSAITYFNGFSGILAALFIIFSFTHVLSKLFSGPTPGPNPFSASHVRASKATLEIDKDERKKVLKQSKHHFTI